MKYNITIYSKRKSLFSICTEDKQNFNAYPSTFGEKQLKSICDMYKKV